MANKSNWLAWVAQNPIQRYIDRTQTNVASVAALLSVSKASVYFWLSGERIPFAQRLAELERFGITTAKDYAAWWAENPHRRTRPHKRKSAIDCYLA